MQRAEKHHIGVRWNFRHKRFILVLKVVLYENAVVLPYPDVFVNSVENIPYVYGQSVSVCTTLPPVWYFDIVSRFGTPDFQIAKYMRWVHGAKRR
jgi:hypothetical protein